MKCITNGTEVRRVNDKVAEHYIVHEGWHYCKKKEQKEGFICSKCGKHFTAKPEKCNGVIKHEDKKIACNSKTFDKGTIYVPVWR